MNDTSPYSPPPAASAQAERTRDGASEGWIAVLLPVLLAVAACAVYWLSAMILDARGGMAHFGADANHYGVLEDRVVNHRAARFHPLTIALGLGWMKLFAPLTVWMTKTTLLALMFAAVGALGVWGATVTFQALLPRGIALLGGVLYASSLGVWYFSTIPESKIVTATLSVLYIAAYVRLRARWTVPGAVLLTATLVAACFNEIVSAFLVAIPAIDALMRRGIDWRHDRWIAGHAATVLVVWAALEILVNGWLVPESAHAEGQSHLNMLLYYMAKNDYGLASLYGFMLNWFLFNFAAPTPNAPYWPEHGGYFAPGLAGYFGSLPAIGFLALLVTLLAAISLPRYRAATLGPSGALLSALAVYAAVRAGFFFAFNPAEPLLFSPAVTLAHWLLLLVPFAASRFPAKALLLTALAVLAVLINGGFILGTESLADAVRALVRRG